MRRFVILLAMVLLCTPVAPSALSAEEPDGFITAGWTTTELRSLDLPTLSTASIGDTSSPMTALARGPGGTLYGIAGTTLHRIDPATGTALESRLLLGGSQALYDALLVKGDRFYASFSEPGDLAGPMEHQLIGWSTFGGAIDQFIPGGENDLMVGLAASCGGPTFAMRATTLKLTRIDLSTGVQTDIGSLGGSLAADEYWVDIAYDHATRTMYALTSEDRLFTVNTSTGAAAPTSHLSEGGERIALTFDSLAECRYSRSLSLRYSKRSFRGRLTSTAQHCYAQRKVSVLRKRPGPDAKIGSDVTDASGRYVVPARRRNGKFYAKTGQIKHPLGICLTKASGVVRLTK
jgi:hypothetical protein